MPISHNFIRRTSAALPAAIVGSLALSLVGAPAHAAEPQSRAPLAPKSPTSALPPVSPAALLAHGTSAAAILGAGAAAIAAPAPTARRVPATYRIVRGDTVSAIAARYGLRTADVLAWNGLGWSTVIYPGQALRLKPPSGAAAAKAPAAKAPAKSTAKPAAKAAPQAATTARAGASYTVRSGDTVSAIAQRHGQSTQAVLAANRLQWSSIIYPGQKLVIPGAATAATSSRPVKTAAKTPVKTTPKPATKAPAKAAPASTGSSAVTVAPGASYVIRAGDTMSAVASRHGVSVTALLHANNMDWSSIVYPGQKVKIPTSGIAGLSTEQAANVRLIVRVGRQLGVSDRGVAIALGTAMQESGLRNLDFGDRDSLGLFQQRPSTGWGTAAQVRNAERSIRAFFGGPGDPNGSTTRGLLDIPGWEKMAFTEAAQAVQISAYPNAYAQWEKPAYAWLKAVG
nr:LysM peptidoglycan-binding domain-containing protein [Microbacterium bovistercoris]